jgi:hypothetical protein
MDGCKFTNYNHNLLPQMITQSSL